MSKQLQDLETETRIYLDEASAADWTQPNVDLAINRSYHDVCSFVMEIYELFYETTTPFIYAVVANQQEYLIDPSLIKVDRVEINYNPTSTGSQPSRCVKVAMEEIATNLANTNGVMGSFFSSAYYLHGAIGAQYIGFIPVPTSSDTTGKSISVWGIALPTDLVNTTDNVNIPYADRFAYLVSLRAAAQLLRKGQQEEAAAARYMQEYRAGITDMQTFLKDRAADGPDMIVDSLNEDQDFSVTGIF
jgi:hypothetical protein